MIIEVFSDFNGSMVLQGWGSVGMTRGGGGSVFGLDGPGGLFQPQQCNDLMIPLARPGWTQGC